MRFTLGFLHILSGMLLCYFDKAKINKQTILCTYSFFFIFKYAVLRNQILLLLLLLNYYYDYYYFQKYVANIVFYVSTT